MTGLIRHLPHRLDLLAIIPFLVGCTSVTPLDAPVNGAVRVTPWVAEDPLEVGLPGQGVPTIDDVLEVVRARETGIFGGGTTDVGFEGDQSDQAVTGYARTTFPASETLRATDLRFEVRHESSGWRIVSMERRYHCAEGSASQFCP